MSRVVKARLVYADGSTCEIPFPSGKYYRVSDSRPQPRHSSRVFVLSGVEDNVAIYHEADEGGDND